LNANDSIQGNVSKARSPSATYFLPHHPPAEARCQASPGLLPWPVHYETIDEPGFGGWADEKIEPAREAAPTVLIGEPAGNEIELTHTPAAPESKKDSSTTFDNISSSLLFPPADLSSFKPLHIPIHP